MVLQNKYKARASRRYNAARGGASDGRGRGGGRGRGAGQRGNVSAALFPSLHAEGQQGEEGDEEEGSGGKESDSEGSTGADTQSKYARRRMESNAWRFREEEVDPHQEGEGEPEAEIDLSELMKRVAKLDSSRTSQALSSREAAESPLQAESEEVDQSLLYLLDRQQEREGKKKMKANGESDRGGSAKTRPQLSVSELKMLEWEGRKLQEEKERERRQFGRAEMLKSQHHQQPRTISLNIGDQRRHEAGQTSQARRQRNIDIAALYGDGEEDDDGKGADDSLDSFLAQIEGQANSSGHQRELEAKTQPLVASASNRDSTSTSARKEHEDFLDSII